MKRMAVVLFVLVWAGAGCGGGAATSIVTDGYVEPDVPVDDIWEADILRQPPDSEPQELAGLADVDLLPDDLPPDEPGPGEFGYPCESGDQCNSGICVVTADGLQCTVLCQEECPQGWQCALHEPSLPDEVYVCAPQQMNACKPCMESTDCRTNGVDLGAFCIAADNGEAYCGGACDDEADCPEGYACTDSLSVDGVEEAQCVLAGDAKCTCSPWFVVESAATGCVVENDWGVCSGKRWCQAEGLTACDAQTPAVESCNGLDDDCDGEVDEGMGGGECFSENGFGKCAGTLACNDGTLNCDAEEPEPEACDGLDNNCDGEVDEGYPDTDEDGMADCLETDKDGDEVPDIQDNCEYAFNPDQSDFDLDGDGDACDLDDDDDQVADEDDCAPFNGDVFPGGEELCNGADDNCDLLVDEGYPDSDADKLADCTDDDDDNDGHPDAVDCQPLDPASFPGAEEACDGVDNNCDEAVDEGFVDTDGDGVADCLETDVDGDGVANGDDNCLLVSNPAQEDLDGDGLGDACDSDGDGDGVPDGLDNCKMLFNPGQGDQDEDGTGDACDEDVDGDGLPNGVDNCPDVANGGQGDQDEDSLGDACDDDDDGDGVADLVDNCPLTANGDQTDTDLDGVGNACEDDTDGDLVPDADDNCPLHFNPGQVDCDNDGVGAACDEDDDADGVGQVDDNCLCLFNPAQDDLDQDGQGDLCDTDLDGDGIANGLDNCEELFNPGQGDLDLDGEGDPCDVDDDGDKVADFEDNCPLVNNLDQADLDKDDLGDVCDDDDDGDGDPDVLDCSPLDAAVSHLAEEVCDGLDNNCNNEIDEGNPDTDLDGFKDCVDEDDDGDGDPDLTDCESLNPAIHGAAEELCNGTDDNCNQQADEGFGVLTCGAGQCLHSVEECKDGALQFCNPYEGAGPEVCDGTDNDCDGLVDEDQADVTCGLGECLHTEPGCVDGVPALCDPLLGATVEQCDTLDNDCDGLVDEELGTLTCGLGQCQQILPACIDGAAPACDPFDGATNEVCNGLDDDCDGSIDEELGVTSCGLGPCEHTVDNCLDGVPQACDPFEGAVDEVCWDGIDNDCDGQENEICAADCKAYLDANPGVPDGYYTIDVDGDGPIGPFEVWCDMTIDGGGWTRFFWLKTPFPAGSDPLGGEVYECEKDATMCLAGIPSGASPADLLVKDLSDKAHAAWHFSGNNVSNAILSSLRDRQKACIAQGNAFMPYLTTSAEQYCGNGAEGGCDSFFYTDGTCSNGKTLPGWGLQLDGDTGCYAAAFKVGNSATPCCGCSMGSDDYAFLNYTGVKDEFGELYWR